MSEQIWDQYTDDGGYTGSVASKPESGRLRQVMELEASDLYYQFDTFLMWEATDSPTPVYYWAEDQGCSCPTPFEGITNLESLDRGPFDKAILAAEQWVRSPDRYWGDGPTKVALLQKIQEMKGKK